MQMIAQNSHTNTSSRIELLGAALTAADEAYAAYDEANLDTEMDDRIVDAYHAEHDAMLEAITLQKPTTLREAAIMLRALDHHLDFLIVGTAEAESQAAREARGEKALAILKAVRAMLTDPEDTGAQEQARAA